MDKNKFLELLENEVSYANVCFNVYKNLYANKENLKLLNATEKFQFFNFLHNILLTELIINITKLGDLETYGKSASKNMSIKGFISIIKKDSKYTKTEKNRLTRLSKNFSKKIDSLKTYRNKVLAHNDLETMSNLVPEPPITLENIEESIKKLNSFMKEFYKIDKKDPTAFEFTIKNIDNELIGMAKQSIQNIKYKELFKDVLNFEIATPEKAAEIRKVLGKFNLKDFIDNN